MRRLALKRRFEIYQQCSILLVVRGINTVSHACVFQKLRNLHILPFKRPIASSQDNWLQEPLNDIPLWLSRCECQSSRGKQTTAITGSWSVWWTEWMSRVSKCFQWGESAAICDPTVTQFQLHHAKGKKVQGQRQQCSCFHTRCHAVICSHSRFLQTIGLLSNYVQFMGFRRVQNVDSLAFGLVLFKTASPNRPCKQVVGLRRSCIWDSFVAIPWALVSQENIVFIV